MRKIRGKQEIYSELTAAGMRLCLAAGILEEGIIFLVLGLQPQLVSVPVFLFLWVLFAVVTAGVVVEADELMQRIRGMRGGYENRRRAAVMTEGSSDMSVSCSLTDRRRQEKVVSEVASDYSIAS